MHMSKKEQDYKKRFLSNPLNALTRKVVVKPTANSVGMSIMNSRRNSIGSSQPGFHTVHHRVPRQASVPLLADNRHRDKTSESKLAVLKSSMNSQIDTWNELLPSPSQILAPHTHQSHKKHTPAKKHSATETHKLVVPANQATKTNTANHVKDSQAPTSDRVPLLTEDIQNMTDSGEDDKPAAFVITTKSPKSRARSKRSKNQIIPVMSPTNTATNNAMNTMSPTPTATHEPVHEEKVLANENVNPFGGLFNSLQELSTNTKDSTVTPAAPTDFDTLPTEETKHTDTASSEGKLKKKEEEEEKEKKTSAGAERQMEEQLLTANKEEEEEKNEQQERETARSEAEEKARGQVGIVSLFVLILFRLFLFVLFRLFLLILVFVCLCFVGFFFGCQLLVVHSFHCLDRFY